MPAASTRRGASLPSSPSSSSSSLSSSPSCQPGCSRGCSSNPAGDSEPLSPQVRVGGRGLKASRGGSGIPSITMGP